MSSIDIKLIPLKEGHLEMVRNWRQLDEVSKYMYTNPKISEVQQIEWFKSVSVDSSKKFFIISFQEKPLGLCSVTDINYVFKRCSWAFYLGDSSVRGQGIGSKVEYNVLNYVFNELNLNKLNCEVFVSNDKVIKMHEKFGFRREAYFRDHVFKDNQFLDVVELAMLKEEWDKLKITMFNKIYKNEN